MFHIETRNDQNCIGAATFLASPFADGKFARPKNDLISQENPSNSDVRRQLPYFEHADPTKLSATKIPTGRISHVLSRQLAYLSFYLRHSRLIHEILESGANPTRAQIV